MNFEDYAQYMIQKHQLAIALTIIKTKPADTTYEAYIESIKNKINEKNMDSNVDIMICEDDFNMSEDFTQRDDQMFDDDDQMMNNDDRMTVGDELNKSNDSVNILKNLDLNDFDVACMGNADANSLLDVITEFSNMEENNTKINNPQINLTQATNFDDTQIPVDVFSTKKNEIIDNVRNFCETYIASNHKVGNDIEDVLNNKIHTVNNTKIISKTRHNHATDFDKNFANTTYCETTDLTDINKYNDNNTNSNKHNIYKDSTNKFTIENNNIDSQKTILYTVQGFTNNTHVSQSQEENFVIANKHLLNRSKTAFNDDSSNRNVKENTQNKRDELFDANLNNKSRNMYSEQDFDNFYANNIETLDKNTNKTNNMYNSQDYEDFGVNEENIIDEINIFSDKDGQRKHKNIESDSHNENKRMKISGNENYSKNYSSRSEFMEFSQNLSNTTKSFEINFYESAEYDLPIFSQNNEKIDFDKTRNKNKEPTENKKKDYSTEDCAFLDNCSNITNTHQIRQNFNIDRDIIIDCDENALEDQFSPQESQSLLLSNLNGNTSLETTLNVVDRHVETKYYIDTDSNITVKDIVKKKTSQNVDIINESPIDLDEQTINLSQNVRSIANYKIKAIIFESKRKESASNDNEIESENPLNTNVKTLEAISNLKENQRHKHILNNLSNNQTKEDISHQKKMKECISNENTQMDNLTQNDLSDNERDNQLEIVPFKVLGDLNRIKSYLNRSEKIFSQGNNSLDSGFRSSQARSSYKSASQYSEIGTNESAHSLLSFVSVSQLSDNTAAIAEEISTILGKLVDKLHEEEKYPNFLEELLGKVTDFLNAIYEGNNEEPNALLKRDDVIYRLLLLNRSNHIIKYTIEKIIIILENTISELKEDVFELKNIDKTENLCHIFHILEILLKRVKKSNESSQLSVQNSQDDDKSLKKSSLTEIWRKKWNLSKSEVAEGSSKKKCVLTKYSEVLNKIIVQAMDGYSLVSFAALQCFNLLQN